MNIDKSTMNKYEYVIYSTVQYIERYSKFNMSEQIYRTYS